MAGTPSNLPFRGKTGIPDHQFPTRRERKPHRIGRQHISAYPHARPGQSVSLDARGSAPGIQRAGKMGIYLPDFDACARHVAERTSIFGLGKGRATALCARPHEHRTTWRRPHLKYRGCPPGPRTAQQRFVNFQQDRFRSAQYGRAQTAQHVQAPQRSVGGTHRAHGGA